MKIGNKGLDKPKKQQKNLEQRVNNMQGEKQVSFEELFSGDFMKAHTEFGSIGEMLTASGYKTDTIEDFEKIPAMDWDAFVSKRTHFANWEEMMRTAAEKYFAKKQGS